MLSALRLEKSHYGGPLLFKPQLKRRYTRAKKAEYLSSVQLSDEQNAITHLAWSQSIPSKSPAAKPNTSLLLSASCLNGSLHLVRISVSATRQDELSQIRVQNTQEIEPTQKFPVMNLAWTQWNRKPTLVIARMGRLTVTTLPAQGNSLKPSTNVSCRYQNYSPVIGYLSLVSVINCHQISFFHQRQTSFQYSSSHNFFLSLRSKPLTTALYSSNRHPWK